MTTVTLLNPIDTFIKEVDSTKREAKKTGNTYIYELCTDMLNFIILFREDSERIDKIQQLNLIKTKDVRAYVDKLELNLNNKGA